MSNTHGDIFKGLSIFDVFVPRVCMTLSSVYVPELLYSCTKLPGYSELSDKLVFPDPVSEHHCRFCLVHQELYAFILTYSLYNPNFIAVRVLGERKFRRKGVLRKECCCSISFSQRFYWKI